MMLRQYTPKKNKVVDRNPYFSTKIPDNVGPRKFPRKNENDHISIKIFYSILIILQLKLSKQNFNYN